MSAASRSRHLLIFIVSLSLIALEVVWTRVLSAEFFYTFAFLIISLAMLGLGLGGLTLRLAPRLATERAIGPLLIATAGLALGGPLAVLHLGVEFAKVTIDLAILGKLALTIGLLSASFFTGGMVIALLFRLHHDDLPRLYRSDLIGAAAGVVAAVALMNVIGTPATVLGLPVLLLVAATVETRGAVRLVCGLLALGPLLLLPWRDGLVAKPRQERLPVVERHWDAMALVKLQRGDGYTNLNIDNAANTPVNAFDGDWEKLRADASAFFLDPQPLMAAMPACRFLSIGAGGGGDVLMALKNGAAEVHAVEVNPFINDLLREGGALSMYSGRLYSDPRVQVVTEDARSYVRRQRGQFDVIYSLSSNTFAALASGAFALAENYLFTTESFRDAYRALRPGGFIIVEHQFYVPRMVSEALDGLRRAGVAEPEKHLAVYALPGLRRQVLLVGQGPLTTEQRDKAFLALGFEGERAMQRVYPHREGATEPTVIERIVRDGWRGAQAESATDLSPATDNRPFTAQQGLLKNLSWARLKSPDAMEYRGFPVAKLLIALVAVLVTLVALPLSFAPLLRHGPRLGGTAWSYFFVVGAAFMVVEVVLLQQFTLLIGPSAYTLAVLLFALLLSSGLGSRYSRSWPDWWPYVGIAAWVVLDAVSFAWLADQLSAWPMSGRMIAAALLIAPVGWCMGMPFAKGSARVGALVDWGFAVNAAAAILGSAGALLLAFSVGLKAALAVGAALYLVAGWLLQRRGGWVRETD